MLYWDEILLMVGPYGDWVKYTYDEPAVLAAECDGVRIITKSKHEFLQVLWPARPLRDADRDSVLRSWIMGYVWRSTPNCQRLRQAVGT